MDSPMETSPELSRYRLLVSQMMTLVVAEKPSVARDLATVLGATQRAEGSLAGNGYIVTWAIGHLVALSEPHQMNAAWKRWSLPSLPMIPEAWSLTVGERTAEQFAIVKRLLLSRSIKDVVCATDAGREGELIFRYVYEAAQAKKSVQRLWISSLTPDAIRTGFRNLRPARDFDALADAARARSRADWLVGMNLSRAYSLVHDDLLSVGRVQTPTLAMIVARDLEIQNFVPEKFLEVSVVFAPPSDGPQTARDKRTEYEGRYVAAGVAAQKARRLPADGALASEIVERAKRGRATVTKVKRETRRIPPPMLYDLSELQRDANRIFGFTAQRTLSILQNLYERYKLVSYPRTDSRYISADVERTLPEILAVVTPQYPPLVTAGCGTRALGKRFVDDRKVADHHAIIPTETPAPAVLPADERKVYDLVCRRLLAVYHEDHVLAITQLVTEIVTDGHVDAYASSGSSIEQVGWKVAEASRFSALPGGTHSAATLPGGLTPGLLRAVVEASIMPKTTEPKPHLSDASLLTAMETAGRTLDANSEPARSEHELQAMVEAMREKGLGTAATRAATLETLVAREYVYRDGKALRATEKGIQLIARVHPHVKSAAMTGEWEQKLAEIERGKRDLNSFMVETERYVTDVLATLKATAPAARERVLPAAATPTNVQASQAAATSTNVRAVQGSTTPTNVRAVQAAATPTNVRAIPAPTTQPSGARQATADLRSLLVSTFGLSDFRPGQEDVCRAVASGKDALVVMPTGAGKSLCYQLPGLARGGTTLVVSPLIALMEDQVAKLASLGLRVARIHSGRDRAESRAACVDYLAGTLDFLFIAPERLGVSGFPEMLAKRKPALIAIDEAHCISQWGHDFRPDYRMLGERLPLLRPTPIVALTATATPDVQDDIVKELRLAHTTRFIRGFRRTNLGVEVLERSKGTRADCIVQILAQPGRLPAIVYAPTRKETEAIAKRLGKRTHAAAYHAGIAAAKRDKVQSAFLSGKIAVVVATTAFGMGVDKANVRTVIHAALPATLEGYYQEIGRAGRDGEPARAVMLHSFHDRKTHEFFLERDYPDAADLAKVWNALDAAPRDSATVRARTKFSEERYERALEKLWVHGGAVLLGGEVARAAGSQLADALQRYAKHIAHKREQLQHMQSYAHSTACRMQNLVRHFGDRNDDGSVCGSCDACNPSVCIGQVLGDDASSSEQAMPKTRKTRRIRKTGRSERTRRVAARPAAVDSALGTALRTFRTNEAKRLRVPAFRILSDRTLNGIAAACPTTEEALLAIAGVGPALLKRFGPAILNLVRSSNERS
jgi:DNA topoisomerase III